MLVQKSSSGTWLIVLDKDQKVLQTLTEIVAAEKIAGGYVQAIGAVKDAELGFYELHKQDYIRKTFSTGDYELISLMGNVSLRDDKPYVHAHVALGKEDFSVFGGHLFEAKVAVTVEVHIHPLGMWPVRQLDKGIGLATIQHCQLCTGNESFSPLC